MRYYLGQAEYKWTHSNTHMEQIWVRRAVGEDLYSTVESNNWSWVLLRTSSQTLPDDVYLRCDIYVDSHDDRQDTLFQLKFPQVTVLR